MVLRSSRSEVTQRDAGRNRFACLSCLSRCTARSCCDVIRRFTTTVRSTSCLRDAPVVPSEGTRALRPAEPADPQRSQNLGRTCCILSGPVESRHEPGTPAPVAAVLPGRDMALGACHPGARVPGPTQGGVHGVNVLARWSCGEGEVLHRPMMAASSAARHTNCQPPEGRLPFANTRTTRPSQSCGSRPAAPPGSSGVGWWWCCEGAPGEPAPARFDPVALDPARLATFSGAGLVPPPPTSSVRTASPVGLARMLWSR